MTKAERLERDIKKLAEMKAHEDELRASGYRYIAGIDEVGRGPLAGPVYAACVVLPADFDVPGVNDSKKLSPKKREELSAVIKERAVAYGIGIADNREIDEINILEATKKAMKRAIDACNEMMAELAEESTKGIMDAHNDADAPGDANSERPRDFADAPGAANAGRPRIDLLLIDAVRLDTDIPCEPIIKGDEKSLSIAAASIVAKVARDSYMTEMDEVYPGYDFAGNKGYGTAKHYQGLRSLGYTPIHRRSFLKKFEQETLQNRESSREQNPLQNQELSQEHQALQNQKTSHDSREKEADSLAKNKIYAVKKGRTTGIFTSWDECKAQVDGFAGAEYKSFKDPKDAMDYLGLDSMPEGFITSSGSSENLSADDRAEEVFPVGVRAYVDGSYDVSTGMFSCGVVMIRTNPDGSKKIKELKEAFYDEEASKQRNVAGEIMGAKTAIDFCLRNGIDSVEIYHDYEGIGKWADGEWKARNPLTQGYARYVAKARTRMEIRFVKVEAHSGNKYNELADKLAKEALGI